MGQVGLSGAFAGLNLFDNSTPTSFDPSVSSLLSRTPQGALTSIANTNSGGSISSACAMNDVYYIAGSFLSIANISTSYVVSYSLSSAAFFALGSGGPDGPVSAVYCDSPNDNLWVGGHFSSPGPSVAVWNSKSNSWSAPPFKGLNGQVMSITSNASDTSLFFTGSFTTSFTGGVTSNNNNPNVPYSPGASPFSSSLVPIPLEGAEVVGAPSSTDPQFSNIQAILCPAGPDGPGNTWLAAAGNAALITVNTFAAMSAYGVRIGNTFLSGYGTTAFRYSFNFAFAQTSRSYFLTLLSQRHINPRQHGPKSYICGSIYGPEHDVYEQLSVVERRVDSVPGLPFHNSCLLDWCANHSFKVDRQCPWSAHVATSVFRSVRFGHQQPEYPVLLCT